MNPIQTLEYRRDILLTPKPPFHFEGTFCKPSYFPSTDTTFEAGIYRQSMRFQGSLYGLRFEGCGAIDQPQVLLSVFSASEISPAETAALTREITYRFDLDADLSPFCRQFASDEILGPVLQRWRGARASNYTSLYEYLVIATVLQNATVRRTVQMHENLLQHFGSRMHFDGRTFAAYWEPAALAAASDEELRALKVGYRSKSLSRQAALFAAGHLDELELRSLPNDELKKRLLSIYGVGPASVGYLMFGVFKRFDAFDTVSPWEQKIFSRLLFGVERVEVQEILAAASTRWGPWKMLAAHYIFEDLFWRRKTEPVPWLEALIRL